MLYWLTNCIFHNLLNPSDRKIRAVRERPFNLKGGGYDFFSKKIFWFPMLLKKILMVSVHTMFNGQITCKNNDGIC